MDDNLACESPSDYFQGQVDAFRQAADQLRKPTFLNFEEMAAVFERTATDLEALTCDHK